MLSQKVLKMTQNRHTYNQRKWPILPPRNTISGGGIGGHPAMYLTTRRAMASRNISKGKACGRFMSMGSTTVYRPIIVCGRSPLSEMGGPGTVTVIPITT